MPDKAISDQEKQFVEWMADAQRSFVLLKSLADTTVALAQSKEEQGVIAQMFRSMADEFGVAMGQLGVAKAPPECIQTMIHLMERYGDIVRGVESMGQKITKANGHLRDAASVLLTK